MPVIDCQTEKLILDTAMRVFFTEGRINATTQDIADAAGVNRTLINYYFGSKKALIATAMKKTQTEFMRNSDLILSSTIPFRLKTEKFIDDFLRNQYNYPFLESFIMVEFTNQRLKKNGSTVFSKKQPAPIKQYIAEIKNEMNEGSIPKYNPSHFLINMFSLMIYPLIMKPLQMSVCNLNEKEYQEILNERKQIIMNILFPPAV
jgi:TetR/AcrR family transcriptional regulator